MLVCSAGVAGLNALVVDYPIEEWKKVFDVNVNGLFYCNRFVARSMKARGYGRIVNIASIAGKEGNPTASAYSASKAAVIGLTKSLGKELAKSGVCVNAITPATIETPILEQVSQAHIDYMRSKIPMGRFGEVGEVAALVCWLASQRVLVQHGRGIRHFRRASDVLSCSALSSRSRQVNAPALPPRFALFEQTAARPPRRRAARRSPRTCR